MSKIASYFSRRYAQSMVNSAPKNTARRVEEILAAVKALTIEYYHLTGKPLGVTGEVAEYVAAKILRLELAPARTAGFDARRRKAGKIECIQIKGRAFKSGKSQKLGKFNIKSPCDIAMMVLLDVTTLEAREIWEAPFEAVLKRLAVPGSNARKRGVLTVGDFKRFGTRVFPA